VEQRTQLGIEGGRPVQRRPCGEGVNDVGFGSGIPRGGWLISWTTPTRRRHSGARGGHRGFGWCPHRRLEQRSEQRLAFIAPTLARGRGLGSGDHSRASALLRSGKGKRSSETMTLRPSYVLQASGQQQRSSGSAGRRRGEP
jgi:hypothetical protein